MSRFSASKTKSFLHAFLPFFGSELSDFDDVYVHGIGVLGFDGSGEGMVGLMSRFGVSFGNFISTLSLGLERNGLFIPVVDGRGNSIHRHDLAHEGGRNAS